MTVGCSATDSHANTSSASFDVHVKGAAEQLADLQLAVAGVGPGTSLADKIAAARILLERGARLGAVRALDSFAREVRAQTRRASR